MSMAAETEAKPIVPVMGAESGYDVEEVIPPLRVSGIVSLLFGLLSITTLIAYPMIAMPILAIFFGLVALRPSEGPKPAGTGVAKIGMFLAVLFGSCGFFIHTLKSNTLAQQAEFFARQYFEVLGQNNVPYALELKKDHINRLPPDIPLVDHYSSNENLAESLAEFRSDGFEGSIIDLGPDVRWTLIKKPRVFTRFYKQKTELVFSNLEAENPVNVLILLEYEIDKLGNGQWRVEQCRRDMKRLVAESIL